jgi:hypothetical protein
MTEGFAPLPATAAGRQVPAVAAVIPGAEVPSGADLVAAGAGGTLPHETTMDDLMAEFRAMQDTVTTLQGKLDAEAKARVQATAPEDIVLYARNAADWLVVHQTMHSDLGPGYFDKPIAASKALAAAAADAVDNPAKLDDVASASTALERWIERTHPRLAGKPIDFGVVLYDLEMVAEAAEKLAPAGV